MINLLLIQTVEFIQRLYIFIKIAFSWSSYLMYFRS